MEPLNGGPSLGPSKIPARKRKPSPEFLTALNLLADSYVISAAAKNATERPKGKTKATQPPAELNH